jgi:hypothetical protein
MLKYKWASKQEIKILNEQLNWFLSLPDYTEVTKYIITNMFQPVLLSELEDYATPVRIKLKKLKPHLKLKIRKVIVKIMPIGLHLEIKM